MARPLISFLSDFGLRDPSVAICHGVIRSIAPDTDVIDISHEVRKYSIRDGALLLWCALPYLERATHLAVVDPGVGTARRPIAIQVGRGDHLVGPDNGLLLLAAERLGGVSRAVTLESPDHRLPVVSSSFHGRDIFAPAAAHLASGVGLEELGSVLPPDELVRLPTPEIRVAPGRLACHVIYVDTFGNVKLTALQDDLTHALGELADGARLTLRLGTGVGGDRAHTATWQTTFGGAPEGAPLVYVDSYGRLCIAVNRGNAAAALGLVDDLEVVIELAG